MRERLRTIPAVHRLLADPLLVAAAGRWGRDQVRDAVREALASQRIAAGRGGAPAVPAQVVGEVLATLAGRQAASYRGVINATGVLIHTNLGRAPRLPADAAGYLALEFDLATGGRGERLGPVTDRLVRYFGCEAAAVVTNNAAALFLLLAAHAAGREVIVSRGELVEIGGSFRLPDLMRASGVRLVEVGCTNRTRTADYAEAIGESTAAILVVHRSNFRLEGFTETPDLGDLVELGRRHGVPVWVDQGSGCHVDLGRFGLRREPTVRDLLAAGADAVLFSGDKLLGGPQAGIVVGTTRAVAPLRSHPLRRALRPDKSVLSGLLATLDAYLAGRVAEVPLYGLLATPPDELRRRARRLARALARDGIASTVEMTRAVLGGGTTPDQTLPSAAIVFAGDPDLADRLRAVEPPVVARVEAEGTVVDLRAVFPFQDAALLASLRLAVRSRRSDAGRERAD